MGGLSLSLGPIHLPFLAFPLCPSPFFQLPIHLPLATQQPSVAAQCSHEDLGRAAPSSRVSHADGEEQSQLMFHPCSGAGCSLWDPPRG